MSAVRSFAFFLWFYLSLGACGLVGLPMALASWKGSMIPIRWWANGNLAALRIICGIRTEFRGLHNLPSVPCIVAMGHQSTYDTIVPFLFLKQPAFVLKQELMSAPILGFYAGLARMIPIDRDGAVRTLKNMLARAQQEFADDRDVVIYPEGTRQGPDAPIDLKSGVAAIYRAVDRPCVPIAVNSGLYWRGSSNVRGPGVMIFEVLPPIEPGLKREEFMRRLRDALAPAKTALVAEGRAAVATRARVAASPADSGAQA